VHDAVVHVRVPEERLVILVNKEKLELRYVCLPVGKHIAAYFT